MTEHDDSGFAPVLRGDETIAAIRCTPTGDALRVEVVPARSFGFLRADVDSLIEHIRAEAQTRAVPTVTLATKDPFLRSHAVAQGATGTLRSDLTLPLVDTPADALRADPEPVDQRIRRWLPDGHVDTTRGSPLIRTLRRVQSGLSHNVRITARRGDVEVSAVVPAGPELMAESLAAALDTMIRISERFPGLARQFHHLVFATSGYGMVTGRVSGEAGGGRISINPAHVDGRAYEALAARAGPTTAPTGGPRRLPRPASGTFLPVDKVVAHEIGHCVDELAQSGRLSSATEFRRLIGEAVGVESVEFALRGERPHAEPAWVAARAELVAQVSDYATTNPVELFAELFSAWIEGESTPAVDAFGELMNARYPG